MRSDTLTNKTPYECSFTILFIVIQLVYIKMVTHVTCPYSFQTMFINSYHCLPEGYTLGVTPLRRVATPLNARDLSVDPDLVPMTRWSVFPEHCPVLVKVKPQTHTSSSSAISGSSTQALAT